MVVGKSSILALIFSVSLLTACANTQETYITSHSVNASVNSNYQSTSTSFATVVNLLKWGMYKLPKEDQVKQEQAVFFALDNLEEGEVTNWYNAKNGSQGAVKISMTYPAGSGHCRVILSQISYKNKVRDFKETACINHLRTWKFIR
tara:strand:+ start:2138 stop:2578 length:441 start_codon:yes stop_codon:yes gene_type:complete